MALAAILASFLSGAARAEFSISGNLPDLEPGSSIQLFREDLDARSQSLEGKAVIQPNHSFKATFKGDPGLFSLVLPNARKIALAIDSNQRVSIEPSFASLSGYAVSGSSDTEMLLAYETVRKESLERLVYPPRAKLNQATAAGIPANQLASLAQAEVDGYAAHRRELNDFTIDQAGTSVALYATSLRWDGDYRRNELKQRVDAIAALHPKLDITRSMQERLRLFELIAIGAQGAPLVGPSLDGETLSLRDYRGKIVLVDFWASWCVPCRVENRHYRDLLDTYSSRGFEVFAVNLDDSYSIWKTASRRDRVTWPQISDSLGWDSPLAAAYNVSALPMSFLLDRNGRIIARNLRGEQLVAKLETVFRKKK